ncbi:HupE/UreJ family protein [Bradyrhizobium liaoningense]|uniref:HupE/UreJ family protein n=1 Tax=Bradyrhizobium liaoningense TaxID=43992 RepID=UPI001BA6F51F|nr:HupE/UreJ family protein [Bradyrhizobium liaoningense]MBR0858278.1 HupE/UreJ family protein [Bradyrhizobium liaoningense]
MRRDLICTVLFGALVLPLSAHAGEALTSFGAGVAHPLGGADHIIAMTMVGLWSLLRGGRAVVVWPLAFVAAMLAGFAAASAGLQVGFVEPAIGLSIAVLGILVALGVRAPIVLGALAVGVFAFFHGHAHGTEAMGASHLPYAMGFTLSTVMLHAVGIAVGVGLRNLAAPLVLSAAGACAVVAGLALSGG